MVQVVPSGSINTTALIVPDLYVQIVSPQILALNGVPTNCVGIVGTAPWGPVNTPVVAGTMGDFATNFGTVMNRTHDLGTAMAICVGQNANNFRLVRVTDGTDTAASAVVLTNCITYTAKYTGSLGLGLVVTHSAGSAANSWRVVVSMPGLAPEVFDNLAVGLTGNAVWLAIASAINNGTTALRPASKLVTAAAGAGTTAVAAASYPFTGGTDGVSGVTDTTLVGVDGTTGRTGMYALRGQGTGLFFLADVTTVSTFTTQNAFALSESTYGIVVTAAGDSVSTAPGVKSAAGIDTYALKYMFGDWIYWYDQVNALTRLVSPQGFVAGRLAQLSPQQSSLNKPLYNIIGSQTSGVAGTSQAGTYSVAALSALGSAGIDVICNPVPGGNYWAVRFGHNASSSASLSGDNYTRMTNYITTTVASGMGGYVGMVVNSKLFQSIRATMKQFLGNLMNQGILGSLTPGQLPFSVVCDTSNNPFSRTSLGYVQCDVAVQYQAINEKFIVNIQGGQTVQVAKQTS